MNQRITQVLLECLVDLGITIVYASIVGLLIVAIVASDDNQVSLTTLALYASLLPAGVMLLIIGDVIARIARDTSRKRRTKHAETMPDQKARRGQTHMDRPNPFLSFGPSAEREIVSRLG